MTEQQQKDHYDGILINDYIMSRLYYNKKDWNNIFRVVNKIESQDGYVLIMKHNTFLFKNKFTGEHMPVQTYYSEPDQRIDSAHECLVKMIKYINSLNNETDKI